MKYCKLISSNFELAFWVNYYDFLMNKKIPFPEFFLDHFVLQCKSVYIVDSMHVVCISEIITIVHTNNTLGLFYDLHINKQ